MKAAQVMLARLDDVEEAMGGLSMRCRQYDNVLTVVGNQQHTIKEQREQLQQMEAAHQQQQHALQQDVERLEGWRKMHFETIQRQHQTITESQQKVERLEGERNNQIQRQQQIINSKEHEIHALKDELAAVHRLLNEG